MKNEKQVLLADEFEAVSEKELELITGGYIPGPNGLMVGNVGKYIYLHGGDVSAILPGDWQELFG